MRGWLELSRGRKWEGWTRRARIGRRKAAAVTTKLLLLPGGCEGGVEAWLLLLRCGREEAWLGPRGMFLAPV